MNKLLKNYPVFLILSAFGPYLSVSLGVKTDNLITYPFAFLIFFIVLKRVEIKINKSILILFCLWIFTFGFLLIRTIVGGGYISTSSFIAETKNFTQPIAILFSFLVILFGFTTEDNKKMIHKTLRILIICLTINTIWIFLGFFVDLTPINQFFWRGEESTAVKAMSNGRYSGIFNQPVEAGVAYSIGLMTWLYLIENKVMKVGVKSAIQLVLIFIGGILTVSKVFIFGGISLFLVSIFFTKNLRSRLIKLLILLFVLGYPPYYYLVHTWDGLNYLLRFFSGYSYYQNGLLDLITAGRYGGENSQQQKFFSRVWEDSPILGQGLGSQQVYDSGFFHFFASGGIIALSAYILILLTFCWLLFEFFYYTGISSETILFLSLVAIIIMGSFGAPVLTLNRSSVILWALVGLLLRYLSLVKTYKFQEQKNNKIQIKTEIQTQVS